MSDDEGNPLGAFAISEDFVQSPTHRQAGTNKVDFDGLLQEKPLQLHEDLAKGNGGQAWPAGHVLAKYLLRMKRDELKKCNSIVELGSGGGLVGLAVAVGCRPAHTMCITDQESMLALMQRNIQLNSLQTAVRAAVYEWGGARPADVPAHPDIVLAADCVYFEPAFPLLQKTLEDLIGANSICYFCFKKRRRADMQFMKAARKTFIIEDVLDDPDREVYARENISL
ncbi:Protein-lysine N-methyltransferase efm6 [Recurvomyces mirabilis]|uniref:Protein-lysine N-methyltransferase EFM6 n=1 Tax=Recurvomyces mirabilis TaxID=574656 RepID=A0AAE0TNB7_9PEZI|nr:Protein-lysine N-methyltransferase efm6 [Recurvomyces mirabilis]KAK5156586.1 Protein-lysine N-methyltransferase efm6 [Recurvomyces mirabilis]